MSMKSNIGQLLALSVLMGGTEGIYGSSRHTPHDDPDAGKHLAQKQGVKKWVCNGIHVQAATKASAIKKARKEYGEGFDDRPLNIYQI
jgi:hypothetical protein